MDISALILAKNEEEMIGDCLKQLDFVKQIIVLDQNSSDKTITIAKKYKAEILSSSSEDFSENRNLLLSRAKSKWVLYLDCDERLNKENIEEIKKVINQNTHSAYYFPRKNIILGKWLKHGGWWPDYVPRLFIKSQLIGWHGRVHESAGVEGKSAYMKNPIIHLTARNLNLMLSKSIKWAKIEAELRYEAHQSKVSILKTIKAAGIEFINRYLLKKGFMDGTIGLVESMYQGLHQVMVMVYLWELQIRSDKSVNNK